MAEETKIINRNSKTINRFLLVIVLIVTWACSNDRIYEKNVDFPNRIWPADSIAIFEFRIPDPSVPYDIYYNIRNTLSYPFQNIYITYYLEDSLGNVIKTELVNRDLFYPKTGEPKGEGLGDLYSHQFLIIPDYDFEHQGLYKLRLQQYMRLDSLPEVVSLGLKVKKSEEM